MGEAIESFAHAQGLRLSAEVLAPLVCEVATAPTPVSAPPAAAAPRVVVAPDSDPPEIAVGRTRAMAPRQANRWPVIAIAVVALAGIGVGAFALRSHRPEPAPAPIAAVVPPEPAPTPAPPPPAPAPTPAPTAEPAVATKPAAKPKPAFLTVSADPWAFVTIDGKRRGQTPLHDLALPAGPHEITFENPPLGVSRSQLVRLRAGEHKTVIERLSK
jgi:hypothetical protein